MVIATGMETRAAEWAAEPSVTVKGQYSTNLTLTDLPHKDTWGPWTSPGVKFKGSIEQLEVSGSAAGDFIQYYGGENVDITNLYFPLAVRYKSEKDTLSFDGGFTRDNTLLGELRQTGVVLRFTQRNQWAASPSWTRSLTEKLSVQAGYQFLDSTYENGLRLGLVDYQVHGGNAGLSYQFSEKTQVQLTGIYTNINLPDLKQRNSYYGPQAALTYSFTESVTGSVAGGPRFITSTLHLGAANLQAQSTAWVFSASLQKKFESARIGIDLGREINPSGFGLLIQSDHLGVSASKELTETLTASAAGQVFVVSPVNSQVNQVVFPDSRYLSGTAKLTWRMNEWWSLEGAYSYAQRDIDSLSVTANSHATFLAVTYNLPRLAVSR